MTTAISNCDSKFCNHDAPSSRPAKPRLTHGTTDATEIDRRLRLHWELADPYTEIAPMPPFTKQDWDYVPYLPEQDARDNRRRIATAALIAGQHEDQHFFYAHPFCTECRGDERAAHRSMETWMAVHPGKDVPVGNETVPGTGGEAPELRLVEQDPDDVVIPFAPTCWMEVVSADRDLAVAGEEFMDIAAVKKLRKERATWFLDGIVPAGRHGIMRGRDASFKSFVALDFCLHIAVGLDWHGRRVNSGRVMYLVGEGVQSFGDRIEAWEETYGELDELESENVLLRNGAVDLYGTNDAFDRLLTKVKEWRPQLLVFDTLQRSAGKADQNSASDMAVVRERIATLQRAAGQDCTTMVVAHTTKGDGDTRGSSSIEDDGDFVLACTRSEMKLKLGIEKQKDGPDGWHVDLAAKAVGDSLVIVDPTEAPPVVWSSSSLDNRICGILRSVAHLDPLSKAEIVTLVQGDDHGKEGASKTMVYPMVNTLVAEGRVLAVPVSKTSTKYAINPNWRPAVDTDPLLED